MRAAREQWKALQRKSRELKRANEILKTASAYFAQVELDRRRQWLEHGEALAFLKVVAGLLGAPTRERLFTHLCPQRHNP
jgi:hypothetical protein